LKSKKNKFINVKLVAANGYGLADVATFENRQPLTDAE
jgi:hypothetical protein